MIDKFQKIIFLVALGIATLLAACSSIDSSKEPSLSPEHCMQGDVVFFHKLEILFCELRQWRRLAPEQLEEQRAAIEARWLKSGQELDIMRLATLYALPDTGIEDSERALNLLDGLQERAESDIALRNLAFYLSELLGVRARCRAQLSRELSDCEASLMEPRNKLHKLENRNRVLLTQLQEAQAEVERLQEQVNALSDLERALETRKRSEPIELQR